MLNADYKELNMTTKISKIPEIVNDNFKITKDIVNSIIEYDSKLDSSQYIKVPIITNGIVKGNTGEFKNIKINNIISETPESTIINFVTDHQLAINRFSKNSNFSDYIYKNYSHDAGYIYCVDKNGQEYNVQSLLTKIENSNNDYSDIFNNIDSSIKSLRQDIDSIMENLNINRLYGDDNVPMMLYSNTEDDNIIKTINSKSSSYTYPAKTYSEQNTNNVKYVYDKFDINNNIKFRYYIANDSYIKINNQYNVAIHCDKIGTELNIIIDYDNIYDNDLIIKLQYNNNSYKCIKVKHNDIELVRLCLVCIDINEYGEVWYLKNYSGTIEIINL